MQHLRRSRIALAAVLLVGVSTSLASAAGEPGAPDTSFGRGGSVLVAFEGLGDGSTADTARGVVLEPDGRIAVAGTKVVGSTSVSTALAALRSDGSLDTSFGQGGRLVVVLANDIETVNVAGLGRQADGKLVVAGTYRAGSSRRLGFLRFTRDGSRDQSFGADGGRLVDPAGVRTEELTAIAIQPDGRIAAAGTGCDEGYATGVCRRLFVVARLTAGGAPDSAFGSGTGVVLTDFSSSTDEAALAVAAQSNGRIVAAGLAEVDGARRFALARYRTNGTLDPTFDGDGRVLTNFASRAEWADAIAIQPDGKIVVAGAANVGTEDQPRWRIALARYRPDGSLDPSFDGDGKVVTGLGPWHLAASAIALQPNGRIVVAGEAESPNGTVRRLALVRYTADGRPDPSFDRDGRVLRVGPSSYATDVAVRLDGRIVTVGASEVRVNASGLKTDFLVTRHRG